MVVEVPRWSRRGLTRGRMNMRGIERKGGRGKDIERKVPRVLVVLVVNKPRLLLVGLLKAVHDKQQCSCREAQRLLVYLLSRSTIHHVNNKPSWLVQTGPFTYPNMVSDTIIHIPSATPISRPPVLPFQNVIHLLAVRSSLLHLLT